jgi:predicted dehydrogenase
MKEIRLALCGIGGHGETYLSPLLREAPLRGARLVAAIDPFPERCRRQAELKEAGVEFFADLNSFFAASECDLVILSSPIQFHCEQTCLALARGCHVLCEKPLCVTEEEAARMAQAEKTSGKTVTIGYQWSFSDAVQELKSDILAGRLGKPVRLKTLVCWPRDERYYRRNDWAGAVQDSKGRLVLDSPVNNGASHYLHNMLYVLGPAREKSAWPSRVEASLYRANAISNYDTAALRIDLEDGAELEFYTSHATEGSQGPLFRYEFEKALVKYDAADGRIQGVLSDGTIVDYGCPEEDPDNKLWSAIQSARGAILSICGIEAARPHVRCVALAQQAAEIISFPPHRIREKREGSQKFLYVPGLQEALAACFFENAKRDSIKLRLE